MLRYMKYLKYVTAGVLAAVLVTTPIVTEAVELTLKLFLVSENSKLKFFFDGVETPIPDDMHIFNYKDANYTSARFVAENLGADVQYDEAENTIYLSKEPVPDTIITLEPDLAFNDVPQRYLTSEWDVSLLNYSKGSDNNPSFSFMFNEMPDSAVAILYEEAYIEYGGERAPADKKLSLESGNTLSKGKERTVVFTSLKNGGVKLPGVKVVLPLVMTDDLTKEEVVMTLVFRVKLV